MKWKDARRSCNVIDIRDIDTSSMSEDQAAEAVAAAIKHHENEILPSCKEQQERAQLVSNLIEIGSTPVEIAVALAIFDGKQGPEIDQIKSSFEQPDISEEPLPNSTGWMLSPFSSLFGAKLPLPISALSR